MLSCNALLTKHYDFWSVHLFLSSDTRHQTPDLTVVNRVDLHAKIMKGRVAPDGIGELSSQTTFIHGRIIQM